MRGKGAVIAAAMLVQAELAAAGSVVTVAGTGTHSYNGDGMPAINADLYFPSGVAFNDAGDMFIMDTGNQRVRRVSAATGAISTVAGTGGAGYTADGVDATTSELNYPSGAAFSPAGDLFVADELNHRVRRIDRATGKIATAVGTGSQGYNGEGIPATAADMDSPDGVVFDASGTLYVVEEGNARVRKVEAATWKIVTVAGTGSTTYNGDDLPAVSANLSKPTALALDAYGNLYIADFIGNRVRRVDAATGKIGTVAGTGVPGYNGDGIPATSAQLCNPWGIALDGSGNLYIADTYNHRIRKVEAATGLIRTVAGTGGRGFNGDGGDALLTQVDTPMGVAVDRAGDLYFADTANNRVRKLTAASSSGGPGASLPQGGMLVAPSVLRTGGIVAILLHGTAGAEVPVAVYGAAGRAMGAVRVRLDAAGRGRVEYTSAGWGGRKPGPGIYWAVASGGGVNVRKHFVMASTR